MRATVRTSGSSRVPDAQSSAKSGENPALSRNGGSCTHDESGRLNLCA